MSYRLKGAGSPTGNNFLKYFALANAAAYSMVRAPNHIVLLDLIWLDKCEKSLFNVAQ